MAYVLAVGGIPFHKYPHKTFSELAVEVLSNLHLDLQQNTHITNDIEEIFLEIVQWIDLDNPTYEVK